MKKVKIFIDGQNFHNRLKDFNIKVENVDYLSFFNDIISEIKKAPPLNINVDWSETPMQVLKADWFTVSDTIIDHYPLNKMKNKHLSPHFKNKNSNAWKKVQGYNVNHPNFPERYKKIFDCERTIDAITVEKAEETILNTKAALQRIQKKYEKQGMVIDGHQLDLIEIKYSGFLKIKYETRTWEEKGVDTAIASQMIASNLDTLHLRAFQDDQNMIPDYNSDIIVLISTDMDFIEPIKFLHTINVPTYMVHITHRLPQDLKTKDICNNIHITKNQLLNFLI